MLIDFHNGSLITTTVAVIWSTEDSHHVTIMTPVITLYKDHMSNELYTRQL